MHGENLKLKKAIYVTEDVLTCHTGNKNFMKFNFVLTRKTLISQKSVPLIITPLLPLGQGKN